MWPKVAAMLCPENLYRYNSSSITNPCVVEFLNAVCFSVYIYVLVLFLICLRWLPNEAGLALPAVFFIGHNIRNFLLLLLIILHSIEFAEYSLINVKIWYIKGVPLIAILSIIICQIFYNRLEKYGKRHFLVISTTFWVCCGVCRSLKFVSNYILDLNMEYVRLTTSFFSAIISYCLIVCDSMAFTLQLQNNEFPSTMNRPNISKDKYLYRHKFCGWYSKITFYWLTSILHLGYRSLLNLKDVTCVPRSEASFFQHEKFEKTHFKNNNNNLWSSIFRLYWKTFIVGGFLKLLGDVTGLVLPLGISIVVSYIENYSSSNTHYSEQFDRHIKWREFLSNGYIMTFIMFLASLVQGTLSQNSTHIINVEGIRMKNALQGLIYCKLLKIRKCLPVNFCDSDAGNIGHITNLVTDDSYNIMSCFWIGNYVWAIPLKIFILIILLYKNIGISAVIGSIACIILMLLSQFIIGMKMTRNYKSISEWSDKRLRRINEILQGIKFIKLCGWETHFIDEITKLRNKELEYLNLDSKYWTIITFLANTSSIILAVGTLILHHLLKNEQITLGTLLTSLALFNQLTVPLFIFPIMVPIIISALVSVKRIEEFLLLPESKSPMQLTNLKTPKDNHIENFCGRRSNLFQKYDWPGNYNLCLHRITKSYGTKDRSKARGSNCSDWLTGNEVLKISNAVYSWDKSSKMSLKIDEISINEGTLNVIIGEKGSGKTSLLLAILGEMVLTSGKTEWKKSLRIGYVPETPWLLSGTVKFNITFGYSFQEKHFARVIQLCTLRLDINKMPNKELTLIGHGGYALSGGQKQRIMIARMLYSRPDIIIMDNSFSALDSRTTNYMFENVIKKFSVDRNKTVIIVSNNKKFLPEANQIIVMENLRLKTTGSYADMNLALTRIQNLEEDDKGCSKVHFNFQDKMNTFHRNLKNSTFVPLRQYRSILSGSRYFTHDLPLPTDDCDVGALTLMQKQKRLRAATVTDYPQSSISTHQMVFRVLSLQPNPCHSIIKREKESDREDEILSKQRPSMISDTLEDWDNANELFTEIFSNVSSEWNLSETIFKHFQKDLNTYFIYVKNCGLLIAFIYILVTLGWQLMRIFTEFWLSSIISKLHTSTPEKSNIGFYFSLYVLLSITTLLLSFCSTATGQYAGSTARKFIHKKLLNNILKCSMQFFDEISFGHMINRFSTDMEIVDKKIPTLTQRLIQFQLLCLSAILLNCLVAPWFVVFVIPIAMVYYKIQIFYRHSSKEFQQVENLLKTPVINHFRETFDGLEVIRALDQSNAFLNSLFQKIDAHTNIFLISNTSNRWLGIMLDYLGGIIVFAAMILSLFSVWFEPSLRTSMFFGLSINYTLLVPIYLTWVVKFSIDLDIYMDAVVQIHSFSKLQFENYNLQAPLIGNWPNNGSIQFIDVTLKYTDNGPAVLHNFNLKITPRQKVGICGRTGSGKSSLMMSLFRMTLIVRGRITIDDVDIDSVPLQYLRSKISIVPQDIILFSGTIRQNLDVKHEFSDEKLWHSLKMVQVDKTVTKIGGLDARVHDGGANLSAGERQLICLARAILHNTCCLILDEATNKLPPETEIEFFNMVLKIFENSTVIVITHRVTSMLNFERILVMDNGELVEDGPPQKLIASPKSKFFELIRTTQELTGEKSHFYF